MKIYMWLVIDANDDLLGPFVFTKKKSWAEVKHLFPGASEDYTRIISSEVYTSD